MPIQTVRAGVERSSVVAVAIVGALLALALFLAPQTTATADAADDCLPGFFGDAETPCAPCPLGSFSGVIGAETCAPCPEGTFSATLASAACAPCASGFFSDFLGATQCQKCPDGKTSAEGATSCYPEDQGFDKDDCKKGGWKDLLDANGNKFKNQGDCVSSVATMGRNVAASGAR